MAWPTTQAGTTNLDSGADNPGTARADIKQNVDNVNNIITEFGTVNITSPANGQALAYDSATSSWINSGSAGTISAYLAWTPSTWTIQSDEYDLVNSVSGADLSLVAGSYQFLIQGLLTAYHTSDPPVISDLDLDNDTAGTKIDDIAISSMVTVNDIAPVSINSAHSFTLASTSNIRIDLTATSTSTTGNLSIIVYRI